MILTNGVSGLRLVTLVWRGVGLGFHRFRTHRRFRRPAYAVALVLALTIVAGVLLLLRRTVVRPLTAEDCWARLLRYAGHWQLLGFGFSLVEERESGVWALAGESATAG